MKTLAPKSALSWKMSSSETPFLCIAICSQPCPPTLTPPLPRSSLIAILPVEPISQLNSRCLHSIYECTKLLVDCTRSGLFITIAHRSVRIFTLSLSLTGGTFGTPALSFTCSGSSAGSFPRGTVWLLGGQCGRWGWSSCVLGVFLGIICWWGWRKWQRWVWGSCQRGHWRGSTFRWVRLGGSVWDFMGREFCFRFWTWGVCWFRGTWHRRCGWRWKCCERWFPRRFRGRRWGNVNTFK